MWKVEIVSQHEVLSSHLSEKINKSHQTSVRIVDAYFEVRNRQFTFIGLNLLG